MTPAVVVREATADDLADLLGVLDAAALETDADFVRRSIDRGDALVAVRGGDDTAERNPDIGGPVLGALVLDGDEIAAVAVRRRLRGQGIGTALVDTAQRRRDRLVAEFDASIRPFYERLGFDVEPADGSGRYRGRR